VTLGLASQLKDVVDVTEVDVEEVAPNCGECATDNTPRECFWHGIEDLGSNSENWRTALDRVGVWAIDGLRPIVLILSR
jgi:hypothetical protein